MKEIFFFCLEFYTQFPEQEAGQARPRWEIILKETYGLPAEPHLCLVCGLNVSRVHGIHPILLPLIVLTLWILSQSIFHKGSERDRVQQWWHNNTWPKSLMLLKSVFCAPTRGGQRHSKAAGAPTLDQLSASGKTATDLACGNPGLQFPCMPAFGGSRAQPHAAVRAEIYDWCKFRAKGLRFLPFRWHCPYLRLQKRNRIEGEGKRARWEDVKMSRCEDVKMRRWKWEDVKMRRWKWGGLKMRRCEDEKMWRWEDVKMRRWEGGKMRRCKDEKIRYRPPLLEEPLRSDALGKKRCDPKDT